LTVEREGRPAPKEEEEEPMTAQSNEQLGARTNVEVVQETYEADIPALLDS
jgi:hypothetical protein